jgi:hypothetical protein
MPRTITAEIEFEEFCFENSSVKITANRACPEIKLGGLVVGPFDEGNEYEVCYWVASELEKFGIARLHQEDQVDASKLNKIQWTERIQSHAQISQLPENFYPKLRRYLTVARAEIVRDPEKTREYEKARQLAQDIINSRLKKVIAIASAPAQTDNTLKNLANEEKFLYERLSKLISLWKTQIIEQREEHK